MIETIQIKKKITGDGKSFSETDVNNESVKDKPKSLGTIKINPNDSKNQEDEIIEMDFENEDTLKNFAQQKTKEAKPLDSESNMFHGETTDSLREKILNEEEAKSQSTSPEDIRKLAKFIINILDTGISTALKFFSGDSTDQPYSLADGKKTMLADQLTIILIKHSVKFKIEILFLIAIIMAYAGPVGVAITTRKKIKAAKQQANPPDRQTKVVDKKVDEVFIENNNNNTSIDQPTIKIKRRRGNPGKG